MLASLVVRHASAYGDLMAEDLGAAWSALQRRLLAGAVMAAAGLLFVQMMCVWILAMTWDTVDRQWVIGTIAGFFFLITCAAGMFLRTLTGRRPAVFNLSAQEWDKDQHLLTEVLGAAPAGAP